MTRTFALSLLWILCSCLYESGDRCGRDQVFSEGGLCICIEGSVPVDGRCEPCGEHEVAAGDHRTCEEGFARDAGGVCSPATDAEPAPWPTGQGEPCGSQADCVGMQAAYCESFFLHQCLVEGCVAGSTPCSDGWICCDFSGVAGVSLCLDAALLEGGTCPEL